MYIQQKEVQVIFLPQQHWEEKQIRDVCPRKEDLKTNSINVYSCPHPSCMNHIQTYQKTLVIFNNLRTNLDLRRKHSYQNHSGTKLGILANTLEQKKRSKYFLSDRNKLMEFKWIKWESIDLLSKHQLWEYEWSHL